MMGRGSCKKVIKKVRDVEQGARPNDKGITKLNESCKIYDDKGELVAIFVKNALPKEMIEIGRGMIRYKGTSNSRGAYAGKKESDKNKIVSKGKYKGTIKLEQKKSNSATIGYLIPYLIENPKPQLSSTTKKDIDFYNTKAKKLFSFIANKVKQIDPEQYDIQKDDLKGIPEKYLLSPITTNAVVNVNQTAHYHEDKGNTNLFGSLCAFGDFEGGELVLGNYKYAFNLKEGDLLWINQSKIHGTLPVEKGERMSIVGYISNKLIRNIRGQYGKGSNIVYVIPSYKRKNVLINKSLKTLNDYNIDKKDIYIFVANQQQKEEYDEVVKMGYNVIIAKKGLTNARNFIIDYFKEGQKIVSLDDDIRSIEKFVNEKKTKKLPSLKDFINNAFKELEKNNLQLGGVYPVNNPYFMKDSFTTELRYIIGAFYYFINDKSQKIEPKFDLSEDYARTIKSFIKYNGVLRYNNITIKTTYYTDEGGLADDRKGVINGKTPEEISKKALYDKYPKYIRPIEKKGRFDIALVKSVKGSGDVPVSQIFYTFKSKDNKPPKTLQDYPIYELSIEKFKKLTNNYYLLNDNKKADKLMKKYNEFYDMWKNARFDIMKVDILRFILLYERGGIVSDLDIIPITNNLNEIVKDIPDDKIVIYTPKDEFNYELIISKKGNELFLEFLRYVKKQIAEKNKIDVYKSWKARYVVHTTGPRSFKRFYEKNKECFILRREMNIVINNKQSIETIKKYPFVSLQTATWFESIGIKDKYFDEKKTGRNNIINYLKRI